MKKDMYTKKVEEYFNINFNSLTTNLQERYYEISKRYWIVFKYKNGTLERIRAVNSILNSDLYSDGYTFEEIGFLFGLSKQRIEQIFQRALKKISNPTTARKIKDYMYIETSKADLV